MFKNSSSQLETARLSVESAQRDLERIHGPLFADIRARTVFYEAFAAMALGAHIAAWSLLGVHSVPATILSAISGGLFAFVLTFAVNSLSGESYLAGNSYSYRNDFLKVTGAPEEELQFYAEMADRYQAAINEALYVIQRRGLRLRIMNGLTMVASVISCLTLTALVMQ